MSKTTLTLSGRILWITLVIVLNIFCFPSFSFAQDASGAISLDSVRRKTAPIPLPVKHGFMPLVKGLPMMQVEGGAPIQITKASAASKPHMTMPSMPQRGSAQERAKAEVVASLLGEDGGEKTAADKSNGLEVASLDLEKVRTRALDAKNGISTDNMISVHGGEPFKLADAVPLVPSKSGEVISIDHATRVTEDTGHDGDEEVDEKFFAKIVRPHDVSRFMAIMKKQGFISLNGKPLRSKKVGSSLKQTVSRGVSVIRPRSKDEMDAATRRKPHETVLADNGGGEWTWPVDLHVSQRISSGFGMRVHPVTGKQAFHQGVDIAAPVGTKVLAAANGVVSLVTSHAHLGHYIRIEHPDGTFSLYGHLSDWKVREGDVVYAGDEIGEIGMSGRTTGPHLDFSIRKNDAAVNPLNYLTIPQSVAVNTNPVYLSMR